MSADPTGGHAATCSRVRESFPLPAFVGVKTGCCAECGGQVVLKAGDRWQRKADKTVVKIDAFTDKNVTYCTELMLMVYVVTIESFLRNYRKVS